MSKVVFLLESMSQGGSERQMLYICKAITDAGHSTTILQYSDGDFYKEMAAGIGTEILKVPSNNKFKKILWMRKMLRKIRPDYVVALVKSASIYAFLASFGMRNIRFILSWRFSNTDIFTKSYNFLLNVFNNKIKAVICNSYNGVALWKAHRPHDESKVHAIYNIININTQDSSLVNKSDKIEIIVPARIQKVKNPELLLESLSNVSKKTKDAIHISWYGRDENGGAYRQELSNYVNELGLENTISFYDATSNIYEKIRESDIVALFSSHEGFPNAICEGMLLSKPILMTAVSDYKYMVDDTNGYLIETVSKEKFVEAFERVSNMNKSQLSEMGKKSFLKGKNLFNNETNSERWAELIEK